MMACRMYTPHNEVAMARHVRTTDQDGEAFIWLMRSVHRGIRKGDTKYAESWMSLGMKASAQGIMNDLARATEMRFRSPWASHAFSKRLVTFVASYLSWRRNASSSLSG